MRFSIPLALLEFLTPHTLFSKLTITKKMSLGYMTLAVLTVAAVVYSLLSLQRMNKLNREIVDIQIPIHESADKMLDALYDQDTYEKRLLILKSADLRNLFRKRADEFRALMNGLKNIPGAERPSVEKIVKLHTQYVRMFEQEMRLMKAGDAAAAAAISNGKLKRSFDKLVDSLRGLSAEAKRSQDRTMKSISEIGRSAFFTTAALCLTSIVLGALSGMVVTHHISSSINKLRVAAGHVAEGDFHYDPQLVSEDEIGALARSFVEMGKRLKKLEEMYLDASPLTRLPGGIAIENILKRRLESGQPLSFCVLDLDNFKIFNDHYGHVHGNRVIQETARIIETAVREKGAPNDFVGHVGGDDFVVITAPAFMREVCAEIIGAFDRRIPEFYNQKDRSNGFILGKNRQGQEMRFPLMTISIAIVTNEHRSLGTPLETSEIAAELKDYAKTIPASVYVVDKRRAG